MNKENALQSLKFYVEADYKRFASKGRQCLSLRTKAFIANRIVYTTLTVEDVVTQHPQITKGQITIYINQWQQGLYDIPDVDLHTLCTIPQNQRAYEEAQAYNTQVEKINPPIASAYERILELEAQIEKLRSQVSVDDLNKRTDTALEMLDKWFVKVTAGNLLVGQKFIGAIGRTLVVERKSGNHVYALDLTDNKIKQYYQNMPVLVGV